MSLERGSVMSLGGWLRQVEAAVERVRGRVVVVVVELEDAFAEIVPEFVADDVRDRGGVDPRAAPSQ